MTHQKTFQQRVLTEVPAKGWLLPFILKQLLPWLFENMPKIIAIWKELFPDKQANIIMEDLKPDPGTTPDAP